MMSLPSYLLYLISFLSALSISLFTVPQIIALAGKKQLFDLPDDVRKLHTHRTTSNLGGIAIFFAYIITSSLIVPPALFDKWHYMIAASLLFFVTGMMDDLVALSPAKKFIAQLIPAIIMVVLADVRIRYMPGIDGQLPYWFSTGFTIVLYLFTINAYNLIDGIDMLAGSMGTLYTLVLGACLALTGNIGVACVAFALAGATLGFLRYNVTPAKIFMGDTGSLLLGFTITTLSVLFIDSFDPDAPIMQVIDTPNGSVVFCIGVLSVPLFDCMRVFFLRIKEGVSPFRADRRHAHYYLTDIGFTHIQATIILVTANIGLIILAFLIQNMHAAIATLIIVAVASLLFLILYRVRKAKQVNR